MPHPKAVAVGLGGVTRHLLYDFNALCQLRDVDVNAFRLGDVDLEDPRVIRKLVWAGLLAESPDLTLDQVGGWLDLSNLADVAAAFTKAFERSTQRENPDPH